jgi:hypothetical protein
VLRRGRREQSNCIYAMLERPPAKIHFPMCHSPWTGIDDDTLLIAELNFSTRRDEGAQQFQA